MSLLLQLNGDLPECFPNDERRLHIFSCRKKACSRKAGSIRATREVRKHRTTEALQTGEEKTLSVLEPQNQHGDLGATLFGATSLGSNSSNLIPFSPSSPASSASSNPFKPLPPTATLAAKSPQPPDEPPTETFASKLRISSLRAPSKPSSPAEPWPPESAFPQPFKYLHLDAEYETLVPSKPQIPDASSASSSSKTQTQYVEDDATATNGMDKDSFESSLDKTFLKFSDRLAQNPEQVLRYEWNGTPLLYSSTDAVGKRFVATHTKTQAAKGMPRCESCGAERNFEMQLVPGAIAALEDQYVDLDEGMEWGTIIVGVCGRNCGDIGEVVFREEWCGVQWEDRG